MAQLYHYFSRLLRPNQQDVSSDSTKGPNDQEIDSPVQSDVVAAAAKECNPPVAANFPDWKSFLELCEFEKSDVENYSNLLLQKAVCFGDRECLDDLSLKGIGIETLDHRKQIINKIQDSLNANDNADEPAQAVAATAKDNENRAANENEIVGNNEAETVVVSKDTIPKPNIRHCVNLLQFAELVRDEMPNVYKVPYEIVSQDENRKLRKCEIGAPTGHGRPNKTILIVGAAGAGKSTLISGMLNYLLGVQWGDNFRFELKDDTETGGSQADSQTTYISAYTVYTDNEILPFDLTIVDTPGFGDTNGIQRDEEITKQIQYFFEQHGNDGVDELHAIGFVTQAPCVRLTPTQRYIFDSILSIFGRDVAENIVLLITFVDSAKPLALEAVKAAKVPYKHFFRFNNSALFANNQEIDEDEGFAADNFWKMGVKSYAKFFQTLGQLQGRSLSLTKEVLKERNNLECFVNNIQPLIQTGLSKLEEIRQEKSVLKQHEAEINGSKDFTYVVTMTKQKKIDLDPGIYVTNCLRCSSTCHFPCQIPSDADKHGCAAMHNGSCTVCAGKCEWQQHFNNPYRFEIYEENDTRTSEELKAKYTGATTGKVTAQKMLKSLEAEYTKNKNDVAELILQVQQCLKRLDQIALKANPLSVVEYIELLMATEKREKKPGFAVRMKQLEEYRAKAVQMEKIKNCSGADCVDEFFNDEDVDGGSFFEKSKAMVKNAVKKFNF